MSEQLKLTVTLHWRDHGSIQSQEMTCADQSPHELIPKLLRKIGLSSGDDASHMVFYRLRLDGEQGPALRTKERLSRQNVADGSRLWLVSELLTKESGLKRCLLRLPDGSEIAVPARGQGLTRTWLMAFLHLHNPQAYAREVERFEQYGSPYRYVSDKRPHCYIRLSDRDEWVVTTDRDDVVTERAADDIFEPVPANVLIRLDNGSRLRLGGAEGLELGVAIL
jgi:hypothetical protein